jgi:hypothetical protein
MEDKNMTFEQWMKKVDQNISEVAGLSSNDLADQNYMDWFEDGMTPMEAAMEALDKEGY